ncbi:MAG: hypothetical protein OEZ02_12165 [Anaerolineae bacterium]|nr:hypothetical protein [Anaerolineae bacterium]
MDFHNRRETVVKGWSRILWLLLFIAIAHQPLHAYSAIGGWPSDFGWHYWIVLPVLLFARMWSHNSAKTPGIAFNFAKISCCPWTITYEHRGRIAAGFGSDVMGPEIPVRNAYWPLVAAANMAIGICSRKFADNKNIYLPAAAFNFLVGGAV